MFGKGAEPKLEPMTAYPKKDLKELASVVNQNKIISIENVNITALPAISIDRIKMKPCMNGFNRGIMFETEHSVDSKYIQAWQKGLGKFIQRDYRKESNTEKYVLIKYIHAFKKNDTVYPLNYYAFCRIITKDEVDGDGIVEDMKVGAARALASLVSNRELNEKFIIPDVFDKRCARVIADEVASVAEQLGLAKNPGNREW